MKKATALFAITTFILAVTSAYLAWSLRAERAQFPALVVAESSQSVSASQEQPGSTPSLPGRMSDSGEKDLGPPAPMERVDASTKAAHQPSLPSRVKNRSQRSADLAYRRLRLQQEHPDLVVAMNLQADEADRLFDLMAQQEANYAEWTMSGWKKSTEGSDDSNQREQQQLWQAEKAEQAALLGEARMADWNRYLTSLGARAEVRDLRILLANSDYPLRRDQYEPLVAVLVPEQVRRQAERAELHRAQGDTTHLTPEQAIKYMDRRMDLIEESLARRRRAAATVLDTEQLRRYDTMLELQRLQLQVEYDAFVTFTAKSAQKQLRSAR